jgi:suppressor for copper-sensitivity B
MISKSTLRSVATGLFVLLAMLTAANPPALAAARPWQQTETVEGQLIAAVEGVGSLDRVPLGLHLKMKPGWKTYWRSPGDAGLPLQLTWEGSGNLGGMDFRWPAPHRFTLFGIETFGYDGEVVFPITARPAKPGQPLDLKNFRRSSGVQ